LVLLPPAARLPHIPPQADPGAGSQTRRRGRSILPRTVIRHPRGRSECGGSDVRIQSGSSITRIARVDGVRPHWDRNRAIQIECGRRVRIRRNFHLAVLGRGDGTPGVALDVDFGRRDVITTAFIPRLAFWFGHRSPPAVTSPHSDRLALVDIIKTCLDARARLPLPDLRFLRIGTDIHIPLQTPSTGHKGPDGRCASGGEPRRAKSKIRIRSVQGSSRGRVARVRKSTASNGRSNRRFQAARRRRQGRRRRGSPADVSSRVGDAVGAGTSGRRNGNGTGNGNGNWARTRSRTR
jgi:hypothetical protein